VTLTGPIWRFPKVQRVLVAELPAIVGAGRVAARTPPNLADVLPFVRVMRVGGGRDRINDLPTVDVDVFAATFTAAEALAEDIDAWLVGPPPAPRVFDRVEVEIAPRELPWGDGTVRRFNATYRIVSRRRRTD
jgi:hypothetical protein